MSEALSSRERILAAVSRQPVDHVPCCGFFNPLDPVLRRGHTWNFPWSPDTPPAEQLRYQVEELGLDQVVYCGANVTRQNPEVMAEVRVEGDVLRKIYHTPAGDLQAAVRYNDLWPHGEDIPFFSDFNVGHFVEPWLKCQADLECLKLVWELRPLEEALQLSRPGIEAQRALADRFNLVFRPRNN